MAAFACFSTSDKESTTDTYKGIITRFKKLIKDELAQETTVISTGASWSYHQDHRDKTVYNFKDFIYRLRAANLSFVCISMSDNPTPQFKSYIRLIEDTKLQDGIHANAYYGDMKKIVTAFISYFTHVVDDTIIRIDKYKHFCSTQNITKLINQTIEMCMDNQEAFETYFVPIETEKEQQMYDEIKTKYLDYLEQMKELREQVSPLSKREQMLEFLNEHFELSLKKINKLCTVTHTYIAMMLAERIYEIAVSVAETVDRINFNMRAYNDECAEKMKNLYHDLYDKNKESLFINRRERRRSVDEAEVTRTIEIIKNKIDHYGNEESLARLELEIRYWMKILHECNGIARNLIRIRCELDHIEVEQGQIDEVMTPDLPEDKANAFQKIKDNFVNRKKYLEEKFVEIARTLVTFFCCRGTDRIFYSDTIGSYYCDEFNHQNYISNYGLKYFHVNCDGDFIEHKESEPYYFDENGRYILVDGEKVHQVAPCTSMYKLLDDGRFTKITQDCGHSEKINENCRMEIKDLTDVMILPKTDIVDITQSLDPETSKYLWDCIGMILPDVLYDLIETQPKNPIHFLSHVLLKHRYQATETELKALTKEADKYRKKIAKERTEKAKEVCLKWRSKQVKRRKPEESDDTQEWAIYNQQVADWQFINSLGYYN